MNEFGQVMTSSPGPMPSAFKIKNRASEPLATPSAWRVPQNAAASASKRSSSSPMMYIPLRPTRSSASCSSSRKSRYCRSRLTNGTCVTGPLSTIEPPDELCDLILLGAGDEFVGRKRDHRLGGGLADREGAGLVSQSARGWLQVHGHRVVHLGVDAIGNQEFLQLVAPLRADDVQVVDLLDPWIAARNADFWNAGERLVEVSGIRNARFGDVIQLGEQVPRDDGLHGIEPGVVGEHRALVTIHQAVIAQQPQPGGELVGIGGGNAAVAPDIQVLERMKAEAADGAKRSR